MWISLVSQSGSEVKAISEELGVWPDYIFSDRESEFMLPEIRERCKIMKHNAIMDFISGFPKAIITLNGYLRIIPDNIVDSNEIIYNVHPGDIENYPELKGKHPQQAALELKLPSTGVIIHKVDKTVDGGEIIDRRRFDIPEGINLAGLINELRLLSIDMWVKLLRGKV